jgi:glycosyltransferase involved in cell wall biosynthesis
MKKRVLIITYYWPPSGGAGVQRWLKFVKYLPEFGWEPVIYTPENPEYPVLDMTLEKDIPTGIKILKTKIWEPYTFYKKFIGLQKEDKINSSFMSEKKKPKKMEGLAVWIRGNLFIPDARRFWIKPSIKYLSNYLAKNPVDAIVTTGPPHSMHMIGLGIKKRFNLPWIVDFRDPWTEIDFYQDLKLTRLADRTHRNLEKQVLQSAHRVVVISKGMRTSFNDIYKREYEVITNGFDTDDFPKHKVDLDKKFSIAHIGSLAKSRNPESLWKTLKKLANEDKAFDKAMEIKLVGKVDFHVMESIRANGLEKYLRHIPYLTHDEVLEEQQRSAILLLLINNTPNAKMILTGKVFEYLSAQRPILCIGPEDGDAADIVSQCKAGKTVGFENKESMKTVISDYFNNYLSNSLHLDSTDQISKFSRKKLAGDIAKLLNEISPI